MVLRPQYMNTLRQYRDVPLVKILAGIRRCGKSTILEMLRDDLMAGGVAADRPAFSVCEETAYLAVGEHGVLFRVAKPALVRVDRGNVIRAVFVQPQRELCERAHLPRRFYLYDSDHLFSHARGGKARADSSDKFGIPILAYLTTKDKG